ncbi:DUF4231 domain-containing protein [Pyxidicoccus fallax]|uniref:DUF4231 domain-containing protein n=1 Tax=Pyxidicoccus fallax TaxID=394095 RepID=A0A848LHN3_9BACT|nr:DUF4231 domain-containing protein [Pyxidicoccus fallax]NMO16931.1 DUF4231 domain-containing protein [Pyxidicoccus fallax]NPC81168.1 DUF4231 domain-containing protein [Pyxidicoccus fallax]
MARVRATQRSAPHAPAGPDGLESGARTRASVEEIHFPNGNSARRITVPPDTDTAEVLQALELPSTKSLLLVIGGADEMDPALGSRLQQLFSRGLAPAAAECDALILDGGTQTGIMALIGQGVAERGHHSPLVGIAPEGRVTYPGNAADGPEGSRTGLDPNHSHFVLVQDEAWGSETNMLCRLATTLGGDIPVLVVLVNGGHLTKEEALRAVRRHWPIVVIQGSGRLADEIATAVQTRSLPASDAVLAEIVGDGDVSVFPLDGAVEGFERLVSRRLGEETVLQLAWQRFATYDSNAVREQTIFRRLQFWILVLGVASTAAVLLQTFLNGLARPPPPSVDLLRYLVVVMVASMTVLIAATSRFKAGTKWVYLRATAEAIKREIYRYRCQVSPLVERPRGVYEQGLASKLKALSHQPLGDEPHVTALRPYRGPLPPPKGAAKGDDGISPLSPVRYLRFRLDDQLEYYRCRIDKLDRQLVVSQWTVIILGGIATVLAATRLELWVALATAIVTAITTHLGYQQSEAKITQYQQAATDLEDLKAWWSALSLEQQSDYRQFDALVDSTELVLQSEVSGWVLNMREVLLRLDSRHEREAEGAPRKKELPA